MLPIAVQVQQFLLFCELELAPQPQSLSPPPLKMLTVHGLILSGPDSDTDSDDPARPWRSVVRSAAATLLQLSSTFARPGESARAAYLRMVGAEGTPSRLQRDVAAILASMGAGAGMQEEVVDPVGGYSIDILLPRALAAKAAKESSCEHSSASGDVQDSGNGGLVAVEVDGPYHYAVGTRIPLGSTVLLLPPIYWLLIKDLWLYSNTGNVTGNEA